VLQMVMIGEESGNLDEMLTKVATIYEFEVDDTVDNLGKILEPVIIVFLGSVVGGLVVAMYLPIFNLMSVLG
ncbi:type II secretion system F family protein, partial [Vibrio fortis]